MKQAHMKAEDRMGSLSGLLIVAVAAVLMACGSLMLRGAIGAIGGFGGEIGRVHEDIFALLGQPIFLLGVVLYGTGTLIWMRALSILPISLGYPILVSLSFLVITIGAAFFFEEALTWPKTFGMLVILVGVVIASSG